MGMIADICAGGTRRKVTNYADAHEAYTRLVAAQNGAVEDFQPDTQGSYTALASISLKSVNAGAFPLDRLIKLRQRENEDGILPPLRRNYRIALDRYVERIKKEAKSALDVTQIEGEFENEIRQDFNHLQEMLQLQLTIPLLTVGFAALAAFFGQPLAVAGALALALPTYRLRRHEILEKHLTGWLHVA